MRFFSYFAAVMIALFLSWALVIFAQCGRPTAMSQWVWDAYAKKTRLAEAIREKKLVIVAGSNALFGVDSAMLERAFGKPVINYGVNAGVMLPYILHVSQRVIAKGDVVILPLEYPMYSYDGEAGMQMIDTIFSRDPGFFWKLTLKEQWSMVWHIDMKRIFEGYFYTGGVPVNAGLYGAHHIDDHGDQINTSLVHRSQGMYDEVLGHKANRYGADFDSSALGWEYLKSFVQWCEEREVQVIFMPSTLMAFDLYKSDAKERWFYEHLGDEVRARGWEYVGDPYDYMYDSSWYLNTDYHLVDQARKIRTRKMIEDLSGFI